ncbi:MAG: HmuY family protein [Bacteroidota bacterium]
MKTKFIPIATLIVFAALTGLFSCKKDNTDPIVLQSKQVSNLAADTIIGIYTSGPATGQPYGSGKFTFYNLETSSIVANSDSATNKWDIAFRGTTIITNSGNSGPANGGALVYVGTFDDLKSVPADSTIRVDNSPSAYAIRTGSGNGWYSYNGAANLITPIPGRVLVIRTASGKYAKIEIQNYYKGGVTLSASASDEEKLSKQRYYTFRFIYQPDGTKNF